MCAVADVLHYIEMLCAFIMYNFTVLVRCMTGYFSPTPTAVCVTHPDRHPFGLAACCHNVLML